MAECRRYYIYPDGTYLEERLQGISLLAEIEICDKKLRIIQASKEPVEVDLTDCINLLDRMVTEKNREKVIDFKEFRKALEERDAFRQCSLDRFLLATYLVLGRHRVHEGRTLLDELLGGGEKG